MAIALDATSKNTGNPNAVTSITWSHTCTGSDLILIAVCRLQTQTVTGMTYNGTAMTLLWASTGYGELNYAYYLVNPSTGTHDLVVSFSASAGYPSGGAASFTGVHQTTPIGTVPSPENNYDSPSSIVVSSATGELVIDAIAHANSSDRNCDVSQTQLFSSNNYDPRIQVSTKPGAASITMTWTGGSAWSSICGVSIKPSEGGASAIKTLQGLAKASVKTVGGLAIASVKSMQGLQ